MRTRAGARCWAVYYLPAGYLQRLVRGRAVRAVPDCEHHDGLARRRRSEAVRMSRRVQDAPSADLRQMREQRVFSAEQLGMHTMPTSRAPRVRRPLRVPRGPCVGRRQ